MGFMRFMKKKKDIQPEEPPFDDLDEPPAPPGLEMPDDIPPPDDFSTMEEPIDHTDKLPDFPEINQDIPELEEAPKPPQMEQHMPEMDVIGQMHENKSEKSFHSDTQYDSSDMFGSSHTHHTQPEIPENEEPDYTEALAPIHNQIDGPVFVRAENFQKVLGRIKETKDLIKSFEDKIFALNEVKNNEDKQYSLWKSRLEDIQRKLIYVDKVLFEER